MSAQDNLSPQQFMPVADLMNTYSSDALGLLRNHAFDTGGDPKAVAHGDNTKMRDVFPRKAEHIGAGETDYSQLDEHIRSGSIDPVLLQRTSSGETEIREGHHRIARAVQLGVSHLPVSYDPGSQLHRYDWDDD